MHYYISYSYIYLYRDKATKSFAQFQKNDDDLIDINLTYLILEYNNIFILHIHILRIFKSIDIQRRNRLNLGTS